MKRTILPFFLVVMIFIAPKTYSSDRIIYGDDNRKDLYEVTNVEQRMWAKSVAMFVSESLLGDHPDFTKMKIKSTTFKERYNLCSEEKFAEQLNPGHCTGFLVGSDLMVTAAHCVRDEFECSQTALVFDYAIQSSNQTTLDEVDKNNVYSCRRILTRRYLKGIHDYALIQLDRSVHDRLPLKFRSEGKITIGDELVLIGHPVGLPVKVVDSATVIGNDQPTYFETNTDSFGANSGSPVFNAETGIVEGILVRGGEDFVPTNRGCTVTNICTNGLCSDQSRPTEGVTRITELSEFINREIASRIDYSGSHVVMVEKSPSMLIPDKTPSGINIPIVIDEDGTVGGVKVTLDITHSYSGDLIVSLKHPDGSSQFVVNREGGMSDDINASFFLKGFAGKSLQGTWLLNIVDAARDNAGILNHFVIEYHVK